MKNCVSVLKCADIAENFPQNLAGFPGILPHADGPVGIGTHGDDLTAQFPETAENIPVRQVCAAAVHAAGIQFQTLAFGHQNPKNLVNDVPVIGIADRSGGGMGMGFGDVKLMGALGFVFGVKNIIVITLVSFIIGAVIGCIFLICK